MCLYHVLVPCACTMCLYLSLSDGGEDGSADHAGVGVELQVIQQQAGGQQHGRGVGRVAVRNAPPGVPGALQERVEYLYI